MGTYNSLRGGNLGAFDLPLFLGGKTKPENDVLEIRWLGTANF